MCEVAATDIHSDTYFGGYELAPFPLRPHCAETQSLHSGQRKAKSRPGRLVSSFLTCRFREALFSLYDLSGAIRYPTRSCSIMGHGGDGASGDAAAIMLDRSKVHILLCDRDSENGLQVMRLLQKCSYQVTCVKSAGKVIELLDSTTVEVDLVLAEVELPKEKGFKMLKHIVRQEQLQHIPVVMMSAHDEMSLVVRCLRLGAVDFLLKPLRSNELLNLWTHTWRRRRMLGISEKHLLNGSLKVPFDLLVSETSESNNTNSTNLFSDDTEDRNLTGASTHGPDNSHDSAQLELSLKPANNVNLEVGSKTASWMPSPPRKSELKVAQSSAFLIYNKVANQCKRPLVDRLHPDSTNSGVHAPTTSSEQHSARLGTCEHFSHGGPLNFPHQPGAFALPVEKNQTQRPLDISSYRRESADLLDLSGNSLCVLKEGMIPFNGDYSQESVPIASRSGSQHFVGGMISSIVHCPPSLLPSPVESSHGLPKEDGFAAGIPAGIPSMHVSPCHALSLTPSFPYYPVGLHVGATPQLGSFPGWHPAMGVERRLGQSERREAALNKFRLKRKDRCFEKKIRYASRKKLAEQRPRVRGQFVRKGTDIESSAGVDEFDEEDQELCGGSSPESSAEDA